MDPPSQSDFSWYEQNSSILVPSPKGLHLRWEAQANVDLFVVFSLGALQFTIPQASKKWRCYRWHRLTAKTRRLLIYLSLAVLDSGTLDFSDEPTPIEPIMYEKMAVGVGEASAGCKIIDITGESQLTDSQTSQESQDQQVLKKILARLEELKSSSK